jgi:hypothetical protein
MAEKFGLVRFMSDFYRVEVKSWSHRAESNRRHPHYENVK